MNASNKKLYAYSGDGHATSIPVIESVSDLKYIRGADGAQITSRTQPTQPAPRRAPSAPATSPGADVMDRLASRFSSFALLAARGRIQTCDVDDLETICEQVQASIEELKAEAERRQNILDSIKRSYVALNHAQPDTGPADGAMIYQLQSN